MYEPFAFVWPFSLGFEAILAQKGYFGAQNAHFWAGTS